MNLEKKIREILPTNDFFKLEKLLSQASMKDLDNSMSTVTFDNESIVMYSLVCMLLIKKETATLHDIAASLLMLPLCHIQGAYRSALYHTRKAVSLSPEDLRLKEGLLLLNVIPDKLVSDEEAREVALEILKKQPTNKAALKTLNPEKYC